MEDEAKHNIDNLIDDLNILKCAMRLEVSQEECPNVDQILDFVMNVNETLIEETTKVVIDKVLLKLLGHKSKQNVIKTANAIAKITMVRLERMQCTTKELIRAVIDLLKEDDIDILTPACLALGDICCNENGANLVREQDGLKVILTVLKKGIALHNVEGASVLRIEATHVLATFLWYQKASPIKALEEGMLPIICSILELDFQNGISNGEASVNVCSALKTLNDKNIVFLDERLARVLVDIVTMDISFDEVSLSCLEIFRDQVMDEKAKLVLAEAGVCEWFLKLLEKRPQCNFGSTSLYLQEVRDLMDLILPGVGDSFVRARLLRSHTAIRDHQSAASRDRRLDRRSKSPSTSSSRGKETKYSSKRKRHSRSRSRSRSHDPAEPRRRSEEDRSGSQVVKKIAQL